MSTCKILWRSAKPCTDMAIFRFFKIAAVRHLGLVMDIFGPPTKSIWWYLSLYKISLESMQ